MFSYPRSDFDGLQLTVRIGAVSALRSADGNVTVEEARLEVDADAWDGGFTAYHAYALVRGSGDERIVALFRHYDDRGTQLATYWSDAFLAQPEVG